MSWSLNFVGVPAAIYNALDDYSDSLTGLSKVEFDEVKQSLQHLVDQNLGHQILQLAASGHAVFQDGEKTQCNCSVNLAVFYGNLVL